MSWGVATQNGVSVSLASIVSLSCGATEFSPASLFTSGVAGAWYDPSDYSTLFQDSAGTTPVTAVEQPVGLMLDKSQGLVLGSELVTNGDFATDTNWTKGSGWGIAGGKASITSAVGTPILEQSVGFSTGTFYKVIFTILDRTAGDIILRLGGGTNAGTFSTNGTFERIFAASGTGNLQFIATNGSTLSVDSVSVKALPGNHASQATAASRPVLRARYNLLTYSEDLSNVAWGASGATKTTSTFTAQNTNSIHAISNSVSFVTGSAYTFSIRLTYINNRYVTLRIYDSSQFPQAVFDLVNGTFVEYYGTGTLTGATITQVSPGVFDLLVRKTSVATGTGNVSVFLVSPTWTSGSDPGAVWLAAGTESVGATRAQLVTGSSAGTYQRIAAATDYATAGFLPYLYFVTDDSFGTNSIDFSATDKMSVCAGVTKLSDATAQTIVELSSIADTNNGAFWIRREYGYLVRSGGGTNTNFTDAVTAPSTNVITLISDFAAPLTRTKVNGVSGATSATPIGGGNFGNYPLFIGRRNNASLPFEGRIYQLIVCGKALSASELASTEAYVATKTGVTI